MAQLSRGGAGAHDYRPVRVEERPVAAKAGSTPRRPEHELSVAVVLDQPVGPLRSTQAGRCRRPFWNGAYQRTRPAPRRSVRRAQQRRRHDRAVDPRARSAVVRAAERNPSRSPARARSRCASRSRDSASPGSVIATQRSTRHRRVRGFGRGVAMRAGWQRRRRTGRDRCRTGSARWISRARHAAAARGQKRSSGHA